MAATLWFAQPLFNLRSGGNPIYVEPRTVVVMLLDQMRPVEEVLSRFDSAPTKRIDLGILTNPDGHRIFIESAGLGLLAIFMSEMRLLEKKMVLESD